MANSRIKDLERNLTEGFLVLDNPSIGVGKMDVAALKSAVKADVKTDIQDEFVTPEEMEEVTESVQTKMVFSIPIGSVTKGNLISGNGLWCVGTLFNTVMNTPIVKNVTKAFFGINQSGNGSKCFIAIYEYDLSNNSISWIANTGNISLSNTGLINAIFEYVKNDSYDLKSDKLYYAVIVSDYNGVKYVGNEITENLNSIPRVSFITNNLNQNTTKETLQTNYANLTPESEVLTRIMIAFYNPQQTT